jgi:hypothetical protein
VDVVKIGEITAEVVAALNLSIVPGTSICLGQSNIQHMLNKHPADYAKYGAYLGEIISAPDYVGVNPSNGSIEYVKDFLVDGEFVKVAVRISRGGRFYARSLYVLNPARVQNFIANGSLKPLTNRLV